MNGIDGDTDLLGPPFEPFPSVRIVDATADLQPIWPCLTSFCGSVVIPWSKHDHMRSSEIVVAIQFPIVSCR